MYFPAASYSFVPSGSLNNFSSSINAFPGGNGLSNYNTFVSNEGAYHYNSVSSTAASSSVGQPGDWESLIPVWGSGRAAIDHFQQGKFWSGVGYTALTISDVFLVKAAATAVVRGAGALIAKTASKSGTGGGLNLFKWGAEQTTKPTGWKAGDYMLNLPKKELLD